MKMLILFSPTTIDSRKIWMLRATQHFLLVYLEVIQNYLSQLQVDYVEHIGGKYTLPARGIARGLEPLSQ